MTRLAKEGRTSRWAGRFSLNRPSVLCSVPLALGVCALGYLVLAVFSCTATPVAIAVCLFDIGLMMMGLRLFIYVRQVEPQYWEARRIPSHRCQKCGYNLTGNVSGVCPECGTRTQGYDVEQAADKAAG